MYNSYYGISPEICRERKSVRKAGNIIGLCELLGFAFSYGLIIFLQFGFILFGATPDFFQSMPYIMLSQALYEFLLFLIPFIICAVLLDHRVSEILPLKPVGVKLSAVLVCIVLGSSVVGSYVSNVLGRIVYSFGSETKMPDFAVPVTPMDMVLNLLVLCAVPALMEEFAFRGIILGSLRRFGDGFAILVSSLLFGLVHGNLVQIPSAFFGGLAFGFITVVCGSMWPAVIAHFLNNAIATFLPMLTDLFPPALGGVLGQIVTLLMVLFGVVGLLGLLIKRPDSLNLKEIKISSKFGTRLKWILTAPMMIVIFVLNILSIVLVQIMY